MKKIELTKEEERTLNYLLTLNKLAENEFFITVYPLFHLLRTP